MSGSERPKLPELPPHRKRLFADLAYISLRAGMNGPGEDERTSISFEMPDDVSSDAIVLFIRNVKVDGWDFECTRDPSTGRVIAMTLTRSAPTK
jgi:hypothetical protein